MESPNPVSPAKETSSETDHNYTTLTQMEDEEDDVPLQDLDPTALQGRLKTAQHQEQEAVQEMTYEEDVFNQKLEEMEQKVEAIRLKRMQLEKVRELQKRRENLAGIAGEPEGPECLNFLESNVFKGIDVLVVVINLGTMVVSFVKGEKFFWLNQAFLVFYFLEWVLMMVFWRSQYYFGSISFVLWNWLDTLIVVVGVIEMWIIPLLSASNVPFLAYVRFLRMARLTRIIKIVHIFCHADLEWTTKPRFESFIMSVIGFNALLLGLEDVFPGASFVWLWTNEVLLGIFFFELLCRLRISGCSFFYEKDLAWNYIDTVIVVGGIIDLWIMAPYRYLTAASNSSTGPMSHFVVVLRLVRLLRVLRIARLVRRVKPLFTLICGIARSMAGMSWVLVLTLTVLYITSIVARKISDIVLAGNDVSPFPDMGTSMFNLFMLMNADVSSMQLLMKEFPWFEWVVVGFMIITNWSIFSILTAVVSDNMASVSEEYSDQDQERKRREDEAAKVQSLSRVFHKADTDGSGVISEEEFSAALTDTKLRIQMEVVCGRTKDELWDVFDCFAQEGLHRSGQRGISKRNFVECLKSGESFRSMIHISKAVDELEKRFVSRLTTSEKGLQEKFRNMSDQLDLKIKDLGEAIQSYHTVATGQKKGV